MTKLLVTGAGGHLGRLVINHLLERGQSVIATTRSPEKLADLAARGVDVRRADFDDRGSLDAAFAGADRALLISTDTLGKPGARIAQHRAAVAALAASGVGHVVYTSMPNADTSVCLIARDHAATEAALAEAGLGYTILRNCIYSEMLLRTLPVVVASGTLVDAKDNGGVAYVTRDDCARAAAGALISATGRSTHDITGPAAVTGEQLAALVTDVTSRPVRYVSVPHDQLVARLVQHGLPPAIAEILASFDVAAAAGDFSAVSPSVGELAGRAPTPLHTFLHANRAALA